MIKEITTSEIVLVCDNCSTEFFRKKTKSSFRHVSLCKRHYCCDICRTSSLSSGVTRSDISQTNLIKYGESTPLSLGRKVFKDKYGVDNPSQVSQFIKKISETNKKLSLTALSRRKKTNLERYGVEYYTNTESFRNDTDWKSAVKLRHENMKKSGHYLIVSKSEENFKKWIESVFQSVDHQVIVNGWMIDFYVKDIDTYLQFDGVYWHGLKKTQKQLSESKSPRDKVILGTVLRDIEQNKWFTKNNLKLVRVTDEEYKHALNSVCLEQLKQKLYGATKF